MAVVATAVLSVPLVLLAEAPLDRIQSTAVDVSPRVAALRLAIKSGLALSSNVIVAVETAYAMPHPSQSSRSLASLTGEARQLAALAGPGAKVAPAGDFLWCEKFICTCVTDAPVLLVNDVSESGGVFIRLYSPSDRSDADVRLEQGIVDVRAKGDAWEAFGFDRPIRTLYHRR
jgi:hypothetical protein